MRRLAHILIGLVLLTGAALSQSALEGIPFDKKLKLAKAGDVEAQLTVAEAYEKGTQTKASKVEAAKWYRAAAQQNNAEAQFRLARLLHDGGDGLKKSPDLAFQLYESAARQGHAMAENWLGYCYQRGLGTVRRDEAAVEWYGKAAAQGLAVAQNNLGLMFLNGKGTARDFTKAFELFSKAAAQDDDWALNNLAGMYEMGWAVAADRARALALYQQAAQMGNSAAKSNLERLKPAAL